MPSDRDITAKLLAKELGYSWDGLPEQCGDGFRMTCERLINPNKQSFRDIATRLRAAPEGEGKPSAIRTLARYAQNMWLHAEAEVETLEGAVYQRDRLIATIITNLKNGRTPEQVIEWFDGEGQAMLAASPSPAPACFECETPLIGPLCPKCNPPTAPAGLIAALEPFAAKATAWEERHPPRGEYPASDSIQITHRLGDFRNARRALAARAPRTGEEG